MRDLLNKEGINHYTTENQEKSSVAERWNRTMKTKMWKMFSARNSPAYLDILKDLVKEYNRTIHSSIKMTPIEASRKKNEKKSFQKS